MARYFMAQGVGKFQRPDTGGDNPDGWRKWPHNVMIGPSGQCAILPPVSGMSINPLYDRFPHGNSRALHAYPWICCHKPIAWKANKLYTPWKDKINVSSCDQIYMWHPYEQDFAHQNAVGPNFDTNTSLNYDVIFDGHHHELAYPGDTTYVDGASVIATPDSFYYYKLGTPDYYFHFGNHQKGKSPFEVQAGHYFPSCGCFGNPGDNEGGVFRIPSDQGSYGIQGGLDFRRTHNGGTTTYNRTPCDVIEYKGSYYHCNQDTVWVTRMGEKGAIIYCDSVLDITASLGGDSLYGVGSTPNRLTVGTDGPTMKCFAIHNDELYMLQNDGILYNVRPGRLVAIKDLTQIGTVWASGITGGYLQNTPLSSSPFPSPNGFRPWLCSFNGQLHAFLNYQLSSTQLRNATGYGIAKASDSTGYGKGVWWGTSYDGLNWSDRTDKLAQGASGIVTPSGNTISRSTWWSVLGGTYLHSAYQGTNYPSGYGALVNHILQTRPMGQGIELLPSGYRQAIGRPLYAPDLDRLMLWSSGNMRDAPGTPHDELQVPLNKGDVSGFLFPTYVNYPSGYAYVDPDQTLTPSVIKPDYIPYASGGVWKPVGQGANGWDFTGVRNRHIAGFVDSDDPHDKRIKLHLSDNPNPSNDLDQTATHFWDINQASGWLQKNYLHWGGCLNGYIPVDVYDPEVVIPSGSLAYPNPRIDPTTDMLKIEFYILDFGFWDAVDVRAEYSLNNQDWHSCAISGQLTGLSTGTKQTDPSGIGADPNQYHTVYWNYKSDLDSRTPRPNVRVRLRAEVA